MIDNFIEDKIKNNFPEKLLYHIWDKQLLKYKEDDVAFRAISGKQLKILFQGNYNTMNGPDFKNAIIEINNQIFTGDIEIHLMSRDWYMHQHDNNPLYNNVVLHVVFSHNDYRGTTLNEKKTDIEILEMKNIFSIEFEDILHKYSETNYLTYPKYCNLFSNIRPEFFEQFMISNGLERLENKIKRFEVELSFISFDQLFYQSILESLGYKKNKKQFYLFSKDYSWHFFKQRNYSMINFVNDLVKSAEFNTEKYKWNLFRVRPCNHPKNRLYQISPFIYQSFSSSLTTEIIKIFSYTKENFSLLQFKKRLYNTLNIQNEFTKHKLGHDKINIIMINIFIPILIIYAKLINADDLKKLCYEIYINYENVSINNIDKIMKKYLTDKQFFLINKKEIYKQGLLNIYDKYCESHLCHLCQ